MPKSSPVVVKEVSCKLHGSLARQKGTNWKDVGHMWLTRDIGNVTKASHLEAPDGDVASVVDGEERPHHITCICTTYARF
jgi:hypothetical protein